jgi:hypothetical protein
VGKGGDVLHGGHLASFVINDISAGLYSISKRFDDRLRTTSSKRFDDFEYWPNK